LVGVSFGRYEEAWQGYESLLWSLIDEHHLKVVCDIGGGAHPVLPYDSICQRGIDYTILDISADELGKAPLGLGKIVADIGEPDLHLPRQFDLVLTRMLAEHMRDGRVFHVNVRRALKPGGLAVHFFPTLYSAPFLVNRLATERLSGWLLDLVSPRDRFEYGKFPAFYSWCRGPTRRMRSRFRGLGYDVLVYRGFFGHGYYRGIPIIGRLHARLSDFLLRHPVSALTSYAWLVLRTRRDD
jgi:SAM-dependent methyltransferase